MERREREGILENDVVRTPIPLMLGYQNAGHSQYHQCFVILVRWDSKERSKYLGSSLGDI